MNDEPTVLAYVQAAAGLLALPLSGPQSQRVVAHLLRTAALYQSLEAAPLSPDDEPPELFRPAPFPETDPGVTP